MIAIEKLLLLVAGSFAGLLEMKMAKKVLPLATLQYSGSTLLYLQIAQMLE